MPEDLTTGDATSSARWPTWASGCRKPSQPLARLAFNYRWSWMPRRPDVFRDIDPPLWERSQAQPARDDRDGSAAPPEGAGGRTGHTWRAWPALAAQVEADLGRPPMAAGIAADRPVAYFCSEFGVHHSLPLYGGGLGVLAGDVLKAASDLAVPMVGVGLLYREGYFHQRLDLSGWQHEWWTTTDFERLPAVLVTGPDQSAPDRRGHDARSRRCASRSGASTSAACRSTCSTPTARTTTRSTAGSRRGCTSATGTRG